jgi:hypothetical protein
MSEGIMLSGILIRLKKERLTKAVSASNTLLGSIKTKVANDANATRNGAAEKRNVWMALRYAAFFKVITSSPLMSPIFKKVQE